MRKLIPLLVLLAAPMAASANAGFYLQGEGGIATVAASSSSAGDIIFSSSGGFGGRVSAGYLWGNNNLNYGVESGIFYGPHLTSTDSFLGFDHEAVKYRIVNTDLLGVLKYTFNNGIALFTKAGAAYTHQHLTVNTTVDNITLQTANKSGSKIAPESAVGVGYQFNPNLEMDLTANAIFAGKASSNNPAALNGAVLLGLTYHFA